MREFSGFPAGSLPSPRLLPDGVLKTMIACGFLARRGAPKNFYPEFSRAAGNGEAALTLPASRPLAPPRPPGSASMAGNSSGGHPRLGAVETKTIPGQPHDGNARDLRPPGSGCGKMGAQLLARTSAGFASIRMKANTQGAGPLLTQACIVPRWTTTSPGFRCATSPLSSSRSHSPDSSRA